MRPAVVGPGPLAAARYDARVTDPIADAPRPGPRPVPGERRLAHPPSDRYASAEPPVTVADPAASGARGLAFAVIAAILGAAAITVLGGVLAVYVGPPRGRRRRPAGRWPLGCGSAPGGSWPAVDAGGWPSALALLAVTLGQLGLWLYARSEGGVLGPLDYLAEVFGPLVPIEFLAASVVAWVTAR